jgi:acetylglutamate kinase
MTPRTMVVKLGGNAIDGAGLTAVAHDLAELAHQGERVVVVHGGGPQTSALQEQLGQTPRKIAGRRVTNEAALDAIKMMVGGKLNIDTCAALCAAGVKPVGLHGASALTIEAVRRPPAVLRGGPPEPVDLGLVGDVVAVNRELIALLQSGGFVPVIACLGADASGAVYNINADVVANQVAVLLGASALVLVSDTRGVLRDVADPQSRIARLTEDEAIAAIDGGAITAGMIPKIEEAFAAIRAGVGRVHIVGCIGEGDIAREMAQPGSVGTVLLR